MKGATRNSAKAKPGRVRPRALPVPGSSLQEELLRFMEYHPAHRCSRNLRKMLLEFLMHDDAIESHYLKDLLYDLDGLFEVLDAMEENENESKGR